MPSTLTKQNQWLPLKTTGIHLYFKCTDVHIKYMCVRCVGFFFLILWMLRWGWNFVIQRLKRKEELKRRHCTSYLPFSWGFKVCSMFPVDNSSVGIVTLACLLLHASSYGIAGGHTSPVECHCPQRNNLVPVHWQTTDFSDKVRILDVQNRNKS